MKYPRLTKELDRRCKLTEKDIKKIRKLKRERYSCSDIAKQFGVSKFLIYYWTNDNTRKNVREYSRHKRQNNEVKKESKLYSMNVNNEMKKNYKKYYKQYYENKRRDI